MRRVPGPRAVAVARFPKKSMGEDQGVFLGAGPPPRLPAGRTLVHCTAMEDVPEVDWKRRFAVALCARFVQKGMAIEDAAEKARAPVDEYYANRTGLSPEAEAELAFLIIMAD